MCSVQAHQKDRVQHPNDQQQRLSTSAARWKETEGTAIDIARQARMVSRSAPVHCGGPQRITSLLVQTSTSQLNLVINYKHPHHIGSSLPSPNISRAAPRSYAHQSHVYAQNHHTMTRATGLYNYRTPAPTTWRCPRSQIRTRTRRPTKVCAACTPGKHAQAARHCLCQSAGCDPS